MTLPLRLLAVDDEPLALRRIELLLAQLPAVQLVGKSSCIEEASRLIEALRPDVLLLDIMMAGQSSIDFVEGLSGASTPLVIFVTAFDEFAPRAFDVGALDYLLKPVPLERLSSALERARRSLIALDAEERLEELRTVIAALRANAKREPAKRYECEIWAERRNEFVRITVEELDWIAAERDYVRLYSRGQSYLLRETISALEARLDPDLFIRVRRSALIRIDRITGIRKAGYGDFRVILSDGKEIRVGRTYVSKIRTLIAPKEAVAALEPAEQIAA